MKIVSVVGARPEFVQAAPLSRALRPEHHEVLVHTGQHYDYSMSQTFFDELSIPAPDYNLEVGSGLHGRQTAEILARLEEVLLAEQPDLVIVRGDTNSTLAGALAASKLHILTAHVEAGERSFDRKMPEEINRLLADALADVLLCVSRTAAARLQAEGMQREVHWVGDVMLDALLCNLPLARQRSDVLARLGVSRGAYALVTVHRAATTDDPARLGQIIAALSRAGEQVIFPVHPRTQKALEQCSVRPGERVKFIPPVGYLDMMVLEENARLIATDSGGVQREAYFLGIPCLTLRDETEWTETVATGWNRLVGTDPDHILGAWHTFQPPAEHPAIFGDGQAAGRIADVLRRAAPLRTHRPAGLGQQETRPVSPQEATGTSAASHPAVTP